jgi:hypothetical protein
MHITAQIDAPRHKQHFSLTKLSMVLANCAMWAALIGGVALVAH